MGELKEMGPDEGRETTDQLTHHLAQLLTAYSTATEINYWSLMLMAADSIILALKHLDNEATISFLDATAKILEAGENTPSLVDQRRKAQRDLLTKAILLDQPAEGSA